MPKTHLDIDFYDQMAISDARQMVVAHALSLQASTIYSELHPEEPSAGWDAQYKEDSLHDAILVYLKTYEERVQK
jgi:hypothetical protein